MQRSTSSAISPVITRYLYFGVQTIWYWQCQIVCDNFRKRLICYSFPDVVGQLRFGCNKWVVQKAKPTELWPYPEGKGFYAGLNICHMVMSSSSYKYSWAVFTEATDTFSSVPRLTAWSFQGVTDGWCLPPPCSPRLRSEPGGPPFRNVIEMTKASRQSLQKRYPYPLV